MQHDVSGITNGFVDILESIRYYIFEKPYTTKEKYAKVYIKRKESTNTMKKKLICILLAATLTAGAGTSEMVSAARTSFATEQADNLQAAAEEPTENLTELTDITLITTKHSSKAIRLRWKDFSDELVSEYYVMRRGVKNSVGSGAWETIASKQSDGVADDAFYHFKDVLASSEPQQYEYKICVLSADGTIDTREAAYEDATNEAAVIGSNIKVCIDAGHYGTLNNNFELTGKDGKFPYSEAVFNLEIAKALQEELRQAYGIDSYLTRESETISLTDSGKTYVNENLDKKNIAVRGTVAKAQGCDLFISLHTNSTSSQTKVWSQPKKINKVAVFVNQTAHASDTDMKIANTIGQKLTDYNKEAGIQTLGFTARSKNNAASFTTATNDSAKAKGTVFYRRSSSGGDYYGVLRGASTSGVPGMIVEHAFHVTQIVRKQAAASSELANSWAACDAYGIAAGYGFIVLKKIQ